jgi:hypothetical protein
MGTLRPAWTKCRFLASLLSKLMKTCSKEDCITAAHLRALTMAINNSHKESPAALLSSVMAEMAKPRVAESAKRVGIKKEYAAPESSAKQKPLAPGRRKAPFHLLASPVL